MGPEALDVFLQSFTCPMNGEVECFLKTKARQSAKLSTSVTYLVWSEAQRELVGYFTLAQKAYAVQGRILSSNNRRLISRFAEEDRAGNFHAAVYLIAQLGKNFSIQEGQRISGAELIGMALDEFRSIKSRVGGKLVMVERENDRSKLLAFYQSNGFKSWTTRDDAKDNVCYDQMFAVI